LNNKKLEFDGIGDNPDGSKIQFKADGTFTMIFVNFKDPVQNYKGEWVFGSC
jgi:hypothetical protein